MGTSGGAVTFISGEPRQGSANPMDRNHPQRKFGPLVGATIVAAVGLLSLLLVDHGPWNRPHALGSETVYATTAAAAHAVGATVTPTAPKPPLEPAAPGPKPAQPANPAS
jgi:hypothetical protein